MSRVPVDPALVKEFLARAEAGDRRGARVRVRELSSHGVAAEAILALIAAVQYEVGLRWQAGMWTVAQEHAATAVSEVAVAALPVASVPDVEAPRVGVVCADGEWHVLPARLFAEQLERTGVAVYFLGGSIPPGHLVETLPTLRLDALAVSCTMPLHLPGAGRTVAAAHACDVPVLLGGAAVSGRPERVAAVGGDALPDDSAEVAAYVDDWRTSGRPTPPPRRGPGHGGALLQQLGAIVVEALAELTKTYSAARDYSDEQLERTREDLAQHVRYLGVAEEIGDELIYVEMVAWLTDLLLARGVQLEAVIAGLDGLSRVLALRGLDHFKPVVQRARVELLRP